MAKIQVLKKHAEVKSFYSTLCLCGVFSFLGRQTHSAGEFDLPADASAIEEANIGASRVSFIELVTPSVVGIGVGFVNAFGVSRAVN